MNNSNFTHLPRVLSPASIAEIKEMALKGPLQNGKNTATLTAKELKNNLQLDPGSAEAKKIEQFLLEGLAGVDVFNISVIPKKIYPPILSKYSDSMAYGYHVDSPVMGTTDLVRTDLAMTLFISEPTEYSGGELVIQDGQHNNTYKLPAGDAILYPANYLHCVNPVTYGERIAIVTWIQSGVQDYQKREALFMLKQVHSQLISRDIYSQEAQILLQVYSNLFKMWIEI